MLRNRAAFCEKCRLYQTQGTKRGIALMQLAKTC